MSDVNAGDLRIIEHADDVIETYEGVANNAKTGIEVELAFINPESEDLTPMSISQNKALKNATNSACGGDFARNEPTSEMLEIGSIAGDENQLRAIMQNAQNNINCLSDKAIDLGLKRSYFQHLPDKTAAQLLENVMDVARYQAFFAPPRDDMKAVAAYFSVCKSNQVSISYKNHDHLLKNIRRLYTLSPFLFQVTDNAVPFNEGRSFSGHAGMYHRAALTGRGGVPKYLYSAQSGEEYIEDHINHVMNNPLFVYYNTNGELIRLPSGQWESFNTLRDKGLNTATNYYFSESILWPDVKIAALKNDDVVIGHRYEARMFGVGLHQHQSALLITAALAFDEAFAQSVDELLKEQGFDLSTPSSLKDPLSKAFEAAQNHRLQFLNIAYGNASMREFARKFALLLENSALMSEYSEELEPILMICRTGLTDSKINHLLFPSLEGAKKFQRSYDSTIFKNPNQNAAQLFQNELKHHESALASYANAV